MAIEYLGLSEINGPLVVLEGVQNAAYDEIVEMTVAGNPVSYTHLDVYKRQDQLYEGQWINKATKDNYHTIRILGNKAVHEGDDTAYDANQAFQLLTQEVYEMCIRDRC